MNERELLPFNPDYVHHAKQHFHPVARLDNSRACGVDAGKGP